MVIQTTITRADFKNSDELYKYNIEQYLTQSLQPEIRKPRRTIKSSLRPRPSPGQGLEYYAEISKEDPSLCLDMSEILSSHNMKQHLHRGWQKRFMDETLSSYTRKAISKDYVQPIDASDYIGATKDMDKMLIDHAKMHNNPNVLGVTNPHPHKMFFTRTARQKSFIEGLAKREEERHYILKSGTAAGARVIQPGSSYGRTTALQSLCLNPKSSGFTASFMNIMYHDNSLAVKKLDQSANGDSENRTFRKGRAAI